MKYIYNQNKNVYLFFYLSLIAILTQGCGNVNFNKNWNLVEAESKATLIIEGGAVATNKSVLDMEISYNSVESFDMMRIATTEDMDAADIAWIEFKNKFKHSLGDLYAANGSKDQILKFFVELKSSESKMIVKTKGQIGLDTIAPTVRGEDILKEGIQGRLFKKNQSVKINFKLDDPISPLNYSSGIHPQEGLKISLSQTSDCSDVFTKTVQDWTSSATTFDLNWPTESPLEAFYVCIFTKDNAGNVGNFLSQPLTSRWRIVAGNNNQGNGASINSENVRFKLPGIIASSPSGQIFIADRQFHNLRAFLPQDQDASRVINLISGTNKPEMPKDGPAQESGFWQGSNSIEFDSQGNGYIALAGRIYKLFLNNDEWQIKTVGIINGHIVLSTRKYLDKESLVIFRATNNKPNTPTSESYLYEIPLDDLNSIDSPLNITTLNNNYKILGNGVIPEIIYVIPDVVELLPNSPTDLKYSLGYPSAITTGHNGEIFIATRADGNGYGWGHHTIRRLTPTTDGKYKQEILSRDITWNYQLSYHKLVDANGSTIEEKISASTHNGFFQINLNLPENYTLPLAYTKPLPKWNNQIFFGGIAKTNSDQSDVEYYISVSSLSQVLHFDRNFNLIETLGRPVYRSNEPDALQGLIGQPEGLVQSPDGTVYFFDSINHIVRSVNPSNHALELVVGQPEQEGTNVYLNEDFSNVKLNGKSMFSGYTNDMVGVFTREKSHLYLGQGAYGLVHGIDLLNKKVTTVSGTTNNEFRWPVSGIATLQNQNGTVTLFNSRAWHYAYGYGSYAPFAGFIERIGLYGLINTVPSSIAMGDLSKNVRSEISEKNQPNENGINSLNALTHASATLHIDSTGNLYRSSYDFLVTNVNAENQPVTRIDVNGSSLPRIKSFRVLEDGDKRYVLYQTGLTLSYFEFNVDQLNKPTPISVTSKSLCFPGGFANNITGMSVSNDGDLLFSDQFNGQIIEYFIRDANGKINFSTCKF